MLFRSPGTAEGNVATTPQVQEEVQGNEITSAFTTNPIATLVIKDYGTVTVELYPEVAPNTVNNFINLANSGFYDGLIFHRIIGGFMMQGGDPSGTGSGGPGYSIAGEFTDRGFQNDLAHEKGVISMARSMDLDSAGSQFFIMFQDSPSLDGKYASFGRVIEGIEVIEAIEGVETGTGDRPIVEVVMESVTVEDRTSVV